MSFSAKMIAKTLLVPDDTESSYEQEMLSWKRCGFPQIQMTHKLCASWGATRLPEPMDVVWPWPSFLVLVPEGVMPYQDTWVQALYVGLGHAERSGLELGWRWLPQVFFADWSRRDGDPEGWQRLNEVARSIIVGAAIELETPHMVERIQLGPPRSKRSLRRSPTPTAWTFQLTRPVKVDIREGLRAYLLGTKGTSPTVQSYIRGYPKRQHHGPGNIYRTWIIVEPHWRGPEDAPIAVRSHLLQDPP